MTKSISQYPLETIRSRFAQDNWLVSAMAGGRILICLTGVASVNVRGRSEEAWHREEVELLLDLGRALGNDYEFLPEQWTQVATPCSWYNQNSANNHGIGVDSWVHGPEPSHYRENGIGCRWWTLRIDCLARDSDAQLIGVAYQVTLLGQKRRRSNEPNDVGGNS
ncbi:MAG: hypothetical protein R3B97_07905 [Dehalococcoidia bacterium]|nr:hypothetical protein [Dehalococcoidia bacterium]MCB9486630.1 hypothetical protein [Thermoflexaceae bacterium]